MVVACTWLDAGLWITVGTWASSAALFVFLEVRKARRAL